MYRIFLIEDDFALGAAIEKQLISWGYGVQQAQDLQQLLPELQAYDPHLVLLDIMLPFYNGFHWCKEIRRLSNVPIVFLSSAADNMNIVMAINMGGDDFIAKPVDPTVLTAKVQAILRRTYEISEQRQTLEHRGAVLNLGDGSMEYNGQRIDLTKNEFRILEILMERRGTIVSRDQLMIRLWQDDCYVEENTLTVNVARLRKKLEANGLTGFIVTKTGSGYLVP